MTGFNEKLIYILYGVLNMGKSLTITEARKMNTHVIEVDLGKHASQLEKLGMDHADAYHFISTVMNLGIAFQEKWDEKLQNISCEKN